jgi:hypothetical protein
MKARAIAHAHAALAVCARPATAEDSDRAEAWRFHLTPYVWLAGVSGTVELPRREAEFGADFGDVLSNLSIGAMGTFEARRGRFGVLVDALYLELEQDVTTPRGIAFGGGETRLTAAEFAALGLYRAIEQPGGSLDLGAGLRAWQLDAKVTLNSGLAERRTATASPSWADPILALRGHLRLSDTDLLPILGPPWRAFSSAIRSAWAVSR